MITHLRVGRDGEIRAVSLKTHTKDGKIKIDILNRPLQRIYPLEVREEQSADDLRNSSCTVETSNEALIETRTPRKPRNAAIKARGRITSWAQDLLEDEPG